MKLKTGEGHCASDLFTWNHRVMEDGTVTHCAVPVHEWLDQQSPGQWIGRRGS